VRRGLESRRRAHVRLPPRGGTRPSPGRADHPGTPAGRTRNALERYLQTRESTILDRRLELTALRSDGAELPVELAVTRLPGGEPPRFAGFLRDRDALPERLLTALFAVASARDGLLHIELAAPPAIPGRWSCARTARSRSSMRAGS
jgi:hypothetical protein